MANMNSILNKNNSRIIFDGIKNTVVISVPRDYPTGGSERPMEDEIKFSDIANLTSLKNEILTMINAFITSKGGIP